MNKLEECNLARAFFDEAILKCKEAGIRPATAFTGMCSSLGIFAGSIFPKENLDEGLVVMNETVRICADEARAILTSAGL